MNNYFGHSITRNGSGRNLFRFILPSILCFIFTSVRAQGEKKEIIEGNKKYQSNNFSGAGEDYKKALEKNKDSYVAAYNLANTLYKQGKYEEAVNHYQALSHRPSSKDTMAMVNHNLGNSLLKLKKYEEAISAYKNALKNNPADEDARYNLAYAQKMLKEQQQNKSQENKEQDSKDKENKDSKDNKKQSDKDKKDNKNKDNKKDDQKDKQDESKDQLSKENAQRLLDALENDEKNIQNKLKKNRVNKGIPVKIEKDW